MTCLLRRRTGVSKASGADVSGATRYEPRLLGLNLYLSVIHRAQKVINASGNFVEMRFQRPVPGVD
jgi:hypothetical protein